MTKKTINRSQEGCQNSRQQKRNGRPPMYTQWIAANGLAQVRNWAEEGLINKQIANNMGINVATLYEWQDRFPEFADALRKGKKVIDVQVENSLLKRALGYQYEEDVYEADANGDFVVVKRVVKTEAPNTAAQIFWMKNRRPEEWRDKVDISNEHSGTIRIELGEQEKWSE